MRECTSCKQSKLDDDFRRDKTRKSGYHSQCKTCCSARYKASYDDKYNVKARQRAANKKVEYSEVISLYKQERGCKCCPENDPVCLEFHHLDPTRKEFGLAIDAAYRNWEKVLAEIEKCVVVCSNCHKKIHAGKIMVR